MYVAIVGSRTYPCRDDVRKFVYSLDFGTVVVSGGAAGVDTWAEEAARSRGLDRIIILADWKTYGRAAGMIRNKEIVAIADRVVAFHDGKSKGTAHTIKLAKAADKLDQVYLPTPEVEP